MCKKISPCTWNTWKYGVHCRWIILKQMYCLQEMCGSPVLRIKRGDWLCRPWNVSGHCTETRIYTFILPLQCQEAKYQFSYFFSLNASQQVGVDFWEQTDTYVTWLDLLEGVNSLHTSRLGLRRRIEGTRLCPAQWQLLDSRTSS